MYELVPSSKFKKDLKACLKRGCKKEDIKTVLDYLTEKGQVPSEYKPHKLEGEYNRITSKIKAKKLAKAKSKEENNYEFN